MHQWLKVYAVLVIRLGTVKNETGTQMVDLQRFENAHYLTVAEVALAMRVSKMTVYRLVHARDLPAVRFGRSYRVPERAMQEYLVAGQHAPAPAHRLAAT